MGSRVAMTTVAGADGGAFPYRRSVGSGSPDSPVWQAPVLRRHAADPQVRGLSGRSRSDNGLLAEGCTGGGPPEADSPGVGSPGGVVPPGGGSAGGAAPPPGVGSAEGGPADVGLPSGGVAAGVGLAEGEPPAGDGEPPDCGEVVGVGIVDVGLGAPV
jgi:hypothetical protein